MYMNFRKEFTSIGIPYDCSTCIYSNCRNRRINCCCENYFPQDTNSVLQDVISKLKQKIHKSSNKRLRRNYSNDNRCKMTCDGDTLDKYYVNMINDTLSQIRKGKIAYLFHLSQVQDVMKFEDIYVAYDVDSCSFAIRIKKGSD